MSDQNKVTSMATEAHRLHRSSNPHRQLRGVLLVDGTTVNCFRKNTHETHIIVLERAGHTYTYIHPDGSQTRHLSPTTLSSHRAMVIETIELRNRFMWQTSAASSLPPYVHRALYQLGDGGGGQLVRRQRRRSSVSNRDQPLRARWPTGTFSTEKLVDPATQRFEIRSIEGNARVCLHPSVTLVDVFYVVQAKRSVDTQEDPNDGNSSDRFDYYATIRQTFTVHHVPPCFAYPVQILAHARSAFESQKPEFELSPDEHNGLFVSSELPGNSAFTARPTFSALSTSHGSDDGESAADSSNSETGGVTLALADVLRVASRPTQKLYERVAVEVMEDAVFYICKPAQDVPSVVVQLADQNAVIECTRGFFRWYGESGTLQQQFTIETIPPATLFATTNASTSVLTLCNHAMDVLRSHGGPSTTSSLRGSFHSSDENEMDLLTAVIEAVETEHGRFRAFADGKVRVVFQDRTILQVNQHQELCSFFFADGSSGQTTITAAPAEQQMYIHRALEFADWAFASPRERMLRYMRRQLNQEVAHQELQKIGIRFGMNHLHENVAGAGDNKIRESLMANGKIEHDSGTDDIPYDLSLPMIKQLQKATQRHIASVNMLLHASTTPRTAAGSNL